MSKNSLNYSESPGVGNANTRETRSFMAIGFSGGNMIIPAIRDFGMVCDFSSDRF